MNDDRATPESQADGCGGELPLLVRQHLDWVYSLCRRSVRDAAMAEDVTQTVFMVLIKKAKHLPQGVNMPGWLFPCLRQRWEPSRGALLSTLVISLPGPVIPSHCNSCALWAAVPWWIWSNRAADPWLSPTGRRKAWMW